MILNDIVHNLVILKSDTLISLNMDISIMNVSRCVISHVTPLNLEKCLRGCWPESLYHPGTKNCCTHVSSVDVSLSKAPNHQRLLQSGSVTDRNRLKKKVKFIESLSLFPSCKENIKSPAGKYKETHIQCMKASQVTFSAFHQ